MKKLIIFILLLLTTLSPFVACEKLPSFPGSDESTDESSGALPPITPNAPQKDPAIDGNYTAVQKYIKENNLSLSTRESSGETVKRIDFAKNIVFHSGFYQNFDHYYCNGTFTDLERFSDNAKFAEIAVNQGYLKKPDTTEFRGDEAITYEDTLRGYLYALGFREYADAKGYLSLADSIGLTDKIPGDKPLSDRVTFGELAQITYNAFYIPIVQCIEKDGSFSVVRRDGAYLTNTYMNAPESKPVFILANDGWDIFAGGGYKYGPSIHLNADGSIDAWFASHSGIPVEVDYGTYRKSYDGGKSWTADVNAIMPTGGSEDWNWTCDPAVIKVGDWYYAAYTSISWHDGVDNNLFIARSKTPEGPFSDKWTGNGWGTKAKPAVVYDGEKSAWGTGEGSMVIVDETLYLYTTWTCGNGNYTYVYTAPANDENWPEKLQYQGVAYSRDNGEDSTDVKYVDAYNCYISVATAERFTSNCYINIRTSFDGKYFRREGSIRHTDSDSLLMSNIHNMGISSASNGHIDIFAQNYVGYAYQPEYCSWGNWPTRFVPIAFVGSELYSTPEKAPHYSSGTKIDSVNVPRINGTRMLNTQNYRLFRAPSADTEMQFYIQSMSATGSWEGIAETEYSKVTFNYDPQKIAINLQTRTIKLLVPEIITMFYSYEGCVSYVTLVPDFVDHSGPMAFYPELETITFTKKGEIKQPSFIAESASGDYLHLWGTLSSATDCNVKDDQEYIKNWAQSLTLSGWNDEIISVDTQTGKITAKAVGQTEIVATYMGKTAKIKIVVENV